MYVNLWLILFYIDEWLVVFLSVRQMHRFHGLLANPTDPGNGVYIHEKHHVGKHNYGFFQWVLASLFFFTNRHQRAIM